MMYYYNQNDYANEQYNKPNGGKATIASGGCGIVSACIAVNNACGKELYSVKQMRDLAQSCGARINNGTDMDKLLKAVCKAHPELSYRATQMNADLLNHLKNGGKAVINQGDVYNVFSTAGHFVAAVQLFDGDVLDIYDPQMYNGKYQQYQRPSRIESATKYGARVKIAEVSKATQDRNPCYWLITYTKSTERKVTNVAKYGNAAMTSAQSVYADSDLTANIGDVVNGQRVLHLGTGEGNVIIAYQTAKGYKVGFVKNGSVRKD